MRIVLAAGGTGGHIVPALAVAEALVEVGGKELELFFVGTGRDIEQRLVGEAGFELIGVPAAPLRGGGLKRVLFLCRTLPSSFRSVWQTFAKRRPDLVIGFGGYPSVMPVLVALLRRIPVVLHESNVEVGIANRLLSLGAIRIYAVSGAVNFLRCANLILLPNPVRRVFRNVSPWEAPVAGKPFRLLVIGGSQGAVSLNRAILASVKLLAQHNVALVHQTGAADLEAMREGYRAAGFSPTRLEPFISDMAQSYAEAHLVVSRAGAMAVAEITATRRPAIYVPLPIAGGHQSRNAASAVKAGAARIVEQGEGGYEDYFAPRLAAEILELVKNPAKLAAMSRAAYGLEAPTGENDGTSPVESSAHRIAKGVLEVASRSRRC